MNKEITKKKILEFLKQYKVCVLSTIHIGEKAPQSAVVGFVEQENLELVFGTSNTTRKYKNLQANKNVSVVIGWTGEMGTIQYEGVVREIPRDESQHYSKKLTKKNPESQKYVKENNQRYFIISPTWIRFVDNTATPHAIYEVTL